MSNDSQGQTAENGIIGPKKTFSLDYPRYDQEPDHIEEQGLSPAEKLLIARNAELHAQLTVAETLLSRVSRYATEDGARTPGSTRLARVLTEVSAWLEAER